MPDQNETPTPKIILPDGWVAEQSGEPAVEVSAEELARLQREALLAMPLAELQSERDRLNEENMKMNNELRSMGAQLDVTSILMQRLEAVIQYGLDEQQRARVEFAFEQAINNVLVDAGTNVRMAKLAQGLEGPGVPQMPSPGGRLPNGRPRR